jgi:hypothetical protein
VSKANLGVLIDDACREIVARRGSFARDARLLVNPMVYKGVADARPQEVARGLPVMLLGLELVPCEGFAPSQFEIAGAG